MNQDWSQSQVLPLGFRPILGAMIAGSLVGCATFPDGSTVSEDHQLESEQLSDVTATPPPPTTQETIVTGVDVSGAPGNYRFAVTLQSPDTGCEQYANWWEVVSEEGSLLYRRILLHSHVDEQPFTRTGGPIDIGADQTVIVRGHMNPGGYGVQAFQGSVANGFVDIDLPPSFGRALAEQPPLPVDCTF